jgi:hypothetical protein
MDPLSPLILPATYHPDFSEGDWDDEIESHWERQLLTDQLLAGEIPLDILLDCLGKSALFQLLEGWRWRSIESLRAVLLAGAQGQVADFRGVTPAWVAAANGHVGALELLRDAKVDLGAPDKDGCTPACIAAEKGQIGRASCRDRVYA